MQSMAHNLLTYRRNPCGTYMRRKTKRVQSLTCLQDPPAGWAPVYDTRRGEQRSKSRGHARLPGGGLYNPRSLASGSRAYIKDTI
ncbi:hypothetical protein DICSQDRAFT_156269 [Dichomitus squalens LYAD-421 SS1]|uniref:Uncharacterized protein n=1 Tax=Dichomitus squalens (strain LYAD-421) TaxID=732165 RepID=R7SX88_DICSQ|nr:uncharacterized protein DICSQDRAFT_156269 [Dichomitus squalens LYAD-421 SS1]EJF59602.1 hypothetical protein DICSQDRAFT_156269 [Dichomitus squalens LYAD-421 SS1]